MFDCEAVLESNMSTPSHNQTTSDRLTLGKMGGKTLQVFPSFNNPTPVGVISRIDPTTRPNCGLGWFEFAVLWFLAQSTCDAQIRCTASAEFKMAKKFLTAFRKSGH
jgi:hypothetical protein